MTITLSQAHSSRRTTLALAATLALTFAGLQGCRKDMAAVQQAPIVDGNDATDPANANMAAPLVNGTQAVYTTTPAQAPRYAAPATRVAGSSYNEPQSQSAENYPPANSARNEAYDYNTQPPQGYAQTDNTSQYNGADDDQLYSDLLDTNTPIAQQPPPPLPVYEQPVAPGPDYLWTPGYWNYAPASYGNQGYYYVPGNWVSAPFVGALWTPGWWGYTGRGYGWHRGYWGRHVGYYGGVNYGFGFIGIGYQGGYWNNDHFFYNRDCNHVEPRVVNNYVYQRNVTVINNTYINNSRTSYYGGPGGLQRRPIQAEYAAQREVHIAPLPAQIAERQQASQNRQQFFAANSGRPAQLFAAHPVIERNVAVPPQLARPAVFNGGAPGANGNQFRQQQAIQQQQLATERQQQGMANQQAAQQRALQQGQRLQQQQANLQGQRNALQNQLQQQHVQQGQQQNQQRLQLDQQRNTQQQQRLQGEGQQQLAHNTQQQQQRFQQQQANLQGQQQRAQQNAQQQQLRQQGDAQRSDQQQAHIQQDQQRAQQQQLRQNQDQQRSAQQQQAHIQQDQQRAQQQQLRQNQDAQRSAQQQQAHMQQDQQRAQQQQFRQQAEAQHSAQQQQFRQQPVPQQQAAHQEQRQPQPQPQQARPQPQQHVEAPHSAPQPQHPQGGGNPRR